MADGAIGGGRQMKAGGVIDGSAKLNGVTGGSKPVYGNGVIGGSSPKK